MSKPETPMEALVLSLQLALIAPTKEAATVFAIMAELLIEAAELSPEQVSTAKMLAKVSTSSFVS